MPGGSTRVYVVCLAKPHPPSGCSGQRSKVAASQPCWVTYCSLVSAVAWRSCTGRGSARRQPWRILFLSKVARTSPMLVGLEASPDSGSQGKLPATPFAPSHRFRHLLEESIQEKNLADHDGGSEPTAGRAHGRCGSLRRSFRGRLRRDRIQNRGISGRF